MVTTRVEGTRNKGNPRARLSDAFEGGVMIMRKSNFHIVAGYRNA
jgi:hypothetical protein